MTKHDPRNEAGTMIAKHAFNEVEATRTMVGGSLDPGKLRTRMVERGERAEHAGDLEYDEDEVASIIDRVKKQHAAMVASSGALDDELDAADMEADNSPN
jgi:hypothetical protein